MLLEQVLLDSAGLNDPTRSSPGILQEIISNNHSLINPRRACAARVTVVGSVTLHLTSRVFVRLTNDTAYLTGQKIFSENAPLQS